MPTKKLATLANELRLHPDELRADLQQYYGIDLDAAMCGGHTPRHVAALLLQLPQDCRIARIEGKDAIWTPDRQLLAVIANQLAMLMWGMSDPKKRGAKPQPIGPEAFRKGRMKSLPARSMPIGELLAELSKPRR